MADSQNLADMKLPELKELAKQMGLRGTSTLRKGDLVSTIEAARSGGEAPAGVTVRPVKASKKTRSAANAKKEDPAAATRKPVPEASAVDAAPRVTAAEEAPRIADDKAVKLAAISDALLDDPAEDGARKGPHAERAAGAKSGNARRTRSTRSRYDAGKRRDDAGEGKLDLDLDLPRIRRRKESKPEVEANEHVRDLGDILAALPDRADRSDRKAKRNRNDDRRNGRPMRAEREDRPEDDEREFSRHGRADRRGNDRNDRRDRRNGRDNRDSRDNRVQREDAQPQTEELVPVAGIIDVLDSYAFVRTSGYLPGPNDVYVSMGQVKKYGLRKGDAVQGTTRPPREGGRNQRQKFVPLQSIETINGMSVEEAQQRPHFNKLTPLYPQERLRMETQPTKLTGRLIDIVSPIGKGQRGLIVSPPKAGKTITLQQIANSITANNPEVHLMVVLVDERPEEVTDMERTVAGEVISSTFDRPASDHTIVAELAIERAKRLVELGQDVVVLLDSMTRLARAYNIAQPASGRILSGGVDAQALYPPKKFFGAARNIENGGSLTIISSALVETGSKMDEVIFEEFKGTGNMELRLSRELADKRLFPAIDINASGTRREELITPPTELAVVYRLRRLFGGMEPEQAYQTLVPLLKKTATNREFLASIVSTIPQNK